MNSKTLLFLFFVFALLSCNTEAKKETETPMEVEAKKEPAVKIAEETIYSKLGGAEGVSAIVEDIIDEHIQNENIKHYFIPLKENPEHFTQFKQHVKDFLSSGTGGPEKYTGRDMPSAHGGLNLSEADFLHAIDDILLVLDNHQVDRNSRNEILATLYSLKWDVIRK